MCFFNGGQVPKLFLIGVSLRDRIHFILTVHSIPLVVVGECEVLRAGSGGSHSSRGGWLLVRGLWRLDWICEVEAGLFIISVLLQNGDLGLKCFLKTSLDWFLTSRWLVNHRLKVFAQLKAQWLYNRHSLTSFVDCPAGSKPPVFCTRFDVRSFRLLYDLFFLRFFVSTPSLLINTASFSISST